MGTISTGIGLISGLPIQDIVTQLIAIEARPRTLLEARLVDIQAQRTAYLDVNARLLAVKNALARFSSQESFRTFRAVSSDSTVFTASANFNASPGSFGLVVKSLVGNHQLVSQGFSDPDTSRLGSGTVTIEVGDGRVNRPTPLDFLNGEEGVRRGFIRITDGSGESADVDLRTASTIQDVIDAINEAEGVQVRAIVSGDALKLIDESEGAGALLVSDLEGGHAAEDLGIAGEAIDGALVGRDLLRIADSMRLTSLNDGTGVGRARGLNDLRILIGEGPALEFEINLDANIRANTEQPELGTRLAQLNRGAGVDLGIIRVTDRAGNSAEIDLRGVDRGEDGQGLNQTTVQDVVRRINEALEAEGVNVRVDKLTGNSTFLTLTDSTDLDAVPEEDLSNLIIEDVEGTTAADLGIVFDNDFERVRGAQVFFVDTIGDVVRAINYSDENPLGGDHVSASITGKGIELVSGRAVSVQSVGSSTAAVDLGLVGASGGTTLTSIDLIGGLNTVMLRSLNGGAGVRGELNITASGGGEVNLRLSGLETVQEVIDQINAQSETTGVSAALNAAENGIALSDSTDGAGKLTVSGGAAEALGIAGTFDESFVTANAQLQYVSEGTELDAMNDGNGVSRGRFRITNSRGISFVVDLSQGNENTILDVIEEINSRFPEGQKVIARVNDQGDGLILTDQAGGDLPLKVEEDGSSTARDLNLLGTSTETDELGRSIIDGSFEYHIDVSAADGLNTLAGKIRDATDGRVTANVLNDGSSTRPYRLSVSSRVGGSAGIMSLDAHEIGLEMSTLIEGRDAALLFGGDTTGESILITSSSNTLEDVVRGVTINLLSTSDDSVTVTVEKDIESLISDMETFVSSFNGVIDRIDDFTRFDFETEQRGPLLGEVAISTVRNRLSAMVFQVFTDSPSGLQRLSDVGINVSTGGRLTFDEEAFREVLEAQPDRLEELFTREETGVAARLEQTLDNLTNDLDGLLTQRDEALQQREDLISDRIEVLTQRLVVRSTQLTNQFQAMERALSLLQSQQGALASLANLVG